METKDKVMLLAEMIREAEGKVAFFGGAGVSTESGIPDFRSATGIYSSLYGRLSPEEIVSGHFFRREPEMFYSFYRDKLIYPEAMPNRAHIALAELEKAGFLSCVITQNIDGLHTAAGSKNIIELHGSALRNYCTVCGRKYPFEHISGTDGVPRCECGGIIRPDVTLFDEALPYGAMESAEALVAESRLMIIGGTSLAVYPAASLIHYAGGRICIINLTETPSDCYADLTIHASLGEVLDRVYSILKEERK